MLGLLDLQGKAGTLLCLHHGTKGLSSNIICIILELLFGTNTLLWQRRTLRMVELKAQVGSATSVRRPLRKPELELSHQPEKLPFSNSSLCTRGGMPSSFRVRGPFRDEKSIGSIYSSSRDTNVDHHLRS